MVQQRGTDPGTVANSSVGKQGDDDTMQTALYGGLNTISSRLNTPLEDSPDMCNVSVKTTGTLAKRMGSLELTTAAVLSPEGTTIVPVTLKSGRNILVAKQDRNIVIYDSTATGITTLMTKTNVFDQNASGIRADWVATAEVEPRIIFTTGLNVPVQVTLLEYSNVIEANTVFSFIDGRYLNATTANTAVFVNGVKVNPVSIVFTVLTDTLTITFAAPQTGIVDVLFITWQWWAEAQKLTGDMVYYSTSRFHVSETDKTLAVPIELLRGIEDIEYGRYPIHIYGTTAWSNIYAYDPTRKPNTATEYTFSTGGMYDAASGDEVIPGYSHITFGAILPEVSPGVPADPQPVHFLRSYRINFNGGRGQSGNRLHVYVDQTLYHLTTQTATNEGDPSTSFVGYYLRNPDTLPWDTVIVNPATRGTYIDFSASDPIGVATSATIEIINYQTAFVGAGAGTEVASKVGYKDGTIIPAYGLGDFADYYLGSFPRTCTVYQGRLVFAGFPLAPMTVVASNVFDSSTEGQFFDNYQTTLEKSLPTDAVDVLLTNTLDDVITGVIEFQNNLFVFSRHAMFRIHGGQAGGITPANVFLNFIASLGAVNAHSIVKVDKTILFLSASGVYDITPTLEAGDFTAGERSIKIRNLISTELTPYNEATSWMLYDALREEVYLAVSHSKQSYVAARLFVYSTLRDAWTEYRRQNGLYFTFHGGVIHTTTNNTRVILATLRNYSTYPGQPEDVTYSYLHAEYPLDMMKTITYAGGTVTATPVRKVTHTTNEWQFEYPTSIEETGQASGFTLFDCPEIEDCKVTWNGVLLTFGVDYVKTHKSSVHLLFPPTSGKSLVIEQQSEAGYPFVLYRDNIRLPATEYTVSESGGNYVATFTTPPLTNTKIRIGEVYPAWHKTPLFTRGSLEGRRRLSHYYGYYANAQEVYTLSDLNGATSQSAEELLGVPKNTTDFTLIMTYDDTDEGAVSQDIYGYTDLYWDDALFGVVPSAMQYKRFSRVALPIIGGISYGFQAVNYSFDDSVFELVGYQITTKKVGRSSLHWSD